MIRITTKPAHCLASLPASMASFPILAETTVKEGWKAGWDLLNHQLALILPDPIVSHLKLKISLTYLHCGKHIVRKEYENYPSSQSNSCCLATALSG